jgi:hypothetical protein
MALQTFTNTRYFSEAAIAFKRDGFYCKAPKGHPDYKAYWAEQKRRCKEGYQVGDLRITGRHYFYLNFCPIKRSSPKKGGGNDIMIASTLTAKDKIEAMRPKELMFPAFWEVDYHWWWAKEIAMNGMYAEEVRSLQIEGLPIKDYLTGHHLACLKTRRAGFSYKEAADGVWNYNFIPNSKSYYFAAKDDFLTKDGILNKVTDFLTHLNKNTGNYWLKNRMEKDQMMHRKASYLDRKRNPSGYMSEILGVIVNDPEKVRGKDGIKVTFEEAGSFKNLKAALAITMPSMKDGDIMTGQVSVFGTGGTEGADIEGLEDIFNTPEAYDMLAFNNIWEEGMEETLCGYYVPCFKTYSNFMDGDGNISIEAATVFDDTERAKKKLLRDPKELDRRVAEFSRTPSEALQRLSLNIFPVADCLQWQKQLLINKELTAFIKYGIVYPNKDGIWKFEPNPEARPVLKYPHDRDTEGDRINLEGCITIYEDPRCDHKGKVHENLYSVVVDPYYKDQAEDLTSLWCAYVIKHKTADDAYGDKIVASFIGRPMSLTTAYRNTLGLAELYDCRIQSEISGGGQGLYDFLKTEKRLHRADFEPTQFNTKENGANERNRNYFMNISTEDKKSGLSYFAEWLMKPRGIDFFGNILRNLHTIYDVALLQEIIKYNGIRNADRISSMIVGMFTFREVHITQAAQQSSATINEFYNRKGFGQSEDSGDTDFISLDSMIE